MKRAIWNGQTLAESEQYELLEGNVYFPRSSIRMPYFIPSKTHTTCPWKGRAHYYTLRVDGKENTDAAWFYPETKPAAAHITDHIAFWKGVEVVDA